VRRLFTFILVAALLGPAAAGCRQAQEAPEPAAEAAVTPAVNAEQPPEPPKPMPAELPNVLARVNGEEVTREDFDRLIKNMELGAGQAVPADRRDEIYRGALDQLITYTVLKQEVRTRNISVPEGRSRPASRRCRSSFPTTRSSRRRSPSAG
jgi:hypothetical protein